MFNEDGVSLTACSGEQAGVLVLKMDCGQNLVNPGLVVLLGRALTLAENFPSPKTLIVTAVGKFFSNGLDLAWMQAHSRDEVDAHLECFWRILARLLTMNCHTVAAINGHAFGAGAFIALACDWRLMRSERGYLNFPEANLGMRLAKPFAELIRAKVLPEALRTGPLTAKRYTAADALKAGLVDEAIPAAELEAAALVMASRLRPTDLGLDLFDPESFKTMKIELYPEAYRSLTRGLAGDPPDSRI